MRTPYFIIDEIKLAKNIESFRLALNKYWPNSSLAYSVKTNSLPWLLNYMRRIGVMAEVVSDEEYQLALMAGYCERDVIFNGPIKSSNYLIRGLSNGAIINIDSYKDIDTIVECKFAQSGNIGVRINVDTDIFETGEVDYAKEGSRFGFSDESGELGSVIKKLEALYGPNSFGLHLHCNSVTRSLAVYREIASYALRIINKHNIKPTFIDIGGGFFGDVEGKPSADDYISEITTIFSKELDIANVKLYIEPGSAIIGSPVDYCCSVLDVKDTKLSRIVTIDGSRLHVDPLWKKKFYTFSTSSGKHHEYKGKQVVCGFTCMDHDRLMSVSDISEFFVGEIITFHRVGAYSVTLGGPFIQYYPDVYLKKENGETIKIRERMTVDQFYDIQYYGGE